MPRRRPKVRDWWYRWDLDELQELLAKRPFFRPKRAQDVRHDVLNLLEAMWEFPKRIDALIRALRMAHKNSRPLSVIAAELGGCVISFRHDLTSFYAAMSKLQDVASRLPPLEGMSEDELVEMWSRDMRKKSPPNFPGHPIIGLDNSGSVEPGSRSKKLRSRQRASKRK